MQKGKKKSIIAKKILSWWQCEGDAWQHLEVPTAQARDKHTTGIPCRLLRKGMDDFSARLSPLEAAERTWKVFCDKINQVLWRQ